MAARDPQIHLLPRIRRGLLVSWDALAAFAGVLIAHRLVFENSNNPTPWMIALAAGVTALIVGQIRGVDRVRPRYFALYDALNLAICAVPQAILVLLMHRYSVGPMGSVAFALLHAFGVMLAWLAIRIGMRLYSWRQVPFSLVPMVGSRRRRILIVGAGDAGEMVAREIQKSREPDLSITGFVDDNPDKRHLIISGVRVLGTIDDIQRIVEAAHVDELLIAMPSVSGEALRRVVKECNRTQAAIRILPSMVRSLDSKEGLTKALREVDIEDLLQRETAKADMKKVAAYVRGESVLITGGGGSIGGELARQLATLGPSNLTLVGKGENSLYEIEQEIIQTTPLEPSALVADVRSSRSIEYAFAKSQPTLVFHAAAHKHVPLMQSHPIEAIENNVFGTLITAQAAIRHGVKRFVYISTDKAVNPTSVMGATKRVGEMIVTALAARSETSFAIVRFGNVLGSRGSLIPMLKSQIARGGPVRVTHRDMTRYFMTIPEAVQLVLHAGANGGNGELFILDMGEPIRILDIAEDLITLSGLVPGKDIEIKFVGTRPGEKIHEELVYSQEQLVATDHSKINMAESQRMDWTRLSAELESLRALCEAGDQEAAKRFLLELANGRSNLGLVQMPESIASEKKI